MIFPAALGALVGAGWIQQLKELPQAAPFLMAACCFGLALVAACLLRKKWMLAPVLGLGVCAALMTAYASAWAQAELRKRLADHLDGQSVWMDVVVMDLPTRHERGWRFEVEVRSARRSGDANTEPVDVPRRGIVNWYLAQAPQKDAGLVFDESLASLADSRFFPVSITPGQHWQFQARLRSPAGTLNPGGFDLEAWMMEKRLYFTASVQQGRYVEPPRLLGMTHSGQIAIDQMRERIRKAIDAALPDHPAAPVLSALVVGDQRAIAASDWAVFQRTGVSHLMSISGLHVTMFAALAGWLGQSFWRALCVRPIYAGLLIPVQSVAALCACLGAFGYALLAGFAIPAQRTAWMVTAMSVATMMGLKASPWSVMGLALLAILVENPMACLSPGFWLSFFAVMMLFGAQHSERRPSVLAQAAHGQAVISLGLLPITVYFFQQIVLVGPLANALAIPVVSFVVTPLAMLGSVMALAFEANHILGLAAWTQNLLHQALTWAAALPWAFIAWPAPSIGGTILASIGAAFALSEDARIKMGRLRHLGWLGMAGLISTAAHPLAQGDLEATFLDVGQGSSVLIRTHQSAVLIDTGPPIGASDAGARIVVPALRRLGVQRLDQLVISHADADHAAGAESVLAEFKVKEIVSAQPFDYSARGLNVGAPGERLCRAGQSWSGDGVRYEVLHPSASVDENPALFKNKNAQSCVLHISKGDSASLLLAGDLPARQELQLAHMFTQLNDPADERAMSLAGFRLQAQVLLAPHHGSKNSSHWFFVSAVNPRFAVIQAGYRNRFGHPHADVLARLEGRSLLRTDLQGQVRLLWRAGSAEPEVSDFWGEGKRYWHRARSAP